MILIHAEVPGKKQNKQNHDNQKEVGVMQQEMVQQCFQYDVEQG